MIPGQSVVNKRTITDKRTAKFKITLIIMNYQGRISWYRVTGLYKRFLMRMPGFDPGAYLVQPALLAFLPFEQPSPYRAAP